MSFVFFMLLRIGAEDRFYEAVAHHIFFIQFNMADTIDILQDADGSGLTTPLVTGEIHLGHIPGNDGLGIGAERLAQQPQRRAGIP